MKRGNAFGLLRKGRNISKKLSIFKNFIGFTLLVDNEVKGAILCREKTWWNNNEIFVEELFVSPEHQGKGYGTALLNTVEGYIKEKD